MRSQRTNANGVVVCSADSQWADVRATGQRMPARGQTDAPCSQVTVWAHLATVRCHRLALHPAPDVSSVLDVDVRGPTDWRHAPILCLTVGAVAKKCSIGLYAPVRAGL